MAKKKEEREVQAAPVAPTDVPDTGLLNPKAAPQVPLDPEVVIAEVDFNELLELEKATKQTADQFDKVAGNIERLRRDLEVYGNHERTLNEQINAKRNALIKRYQLDEKRQWRIDFNTRRVVYIG